MKKTLVAIFLAALAAIVFVLVFKPDLLDRIQQRDAARHQLESPAVDQPKQETPVPSSTAEPEISHDEKPDEPMVAGIVLDRLSGRSIYVNGTDRTGQERCQVPPGRSVVATWKDGRYSHELIDLRAGDEASPEGRLAGPSPAPAWSGFQGGRERTGVADSTARSGFNVRWKSSVNDQVRSSPVIHGGMAFFASDTSFVRAVDLTDGSLLWSHGIVGGKVNPVAVGDFVFAGNDVGRFEGFRLTKGKLKGTASLGSGLAGLAAISDDQLLAVTSGNVVRAIATRKSMVGRLPLKFTWEVTVPGLGGSTATPLILGDRAILQTGDGQLLAISLSNGSVIWPAGLETISGTEDIAEPDASMTFRFAGSLGFLTPTPAAHDGVILAAHRDRIRAVKASDGSTLWERTFDGEVSSSVSLAWDTIYLGCTDGTVRAFSCRQGVPIYTARVGRAPVFASPVLFDGQLLIATGEGKLVLHDAFSGKILAEDRTLAGTPIDATPAVWPDGILVITRDGVMACFE